MVQQLDGSKNEWGWSKAKLGPGPGCGRTRPTRGEGPFGLGGYPLVGGFLKESQKICIHIYIYICAKTKPEKKRERKNAVVVKTHWDPILG